MLLHLVPQAPGVELPSHLMENLTVTLKISRHFRGALLLHNTDIEAHLLFGDSYCECRIPYDAIWGVTSEYGDTTSWLEGFNDSSSPSTGSNPEKDSDVLSELSQRKNSQLTSGNGTYSPDKSDQTSTNLQMIDSIGTRFDHTTRREVDLRQSEYNDHTDHLDSDLQTSSPLSLQSDKEVLSTLHENSGLTDEAGLEIEDDDLGEIPIKDGKETPSFPPRLQSVLKTSSNEEATDSETATGVSQGEERPDGAEKPSASKKTPSPRSRQSGKSDSGNRPKLVRVK